MVEFERGANLLNLSAIKNNDTICQCHCLNLIMRHINHGLAKILVQSRDLYTHVDAQRGIKIG